MDKHRIFRLVFAFAVGVALSLYVYQRMMNPAPLQQRAQEEAVVLAARSFLADAVPDDDIEIVDPLATNRSAGKVYIYPAGDGWQVSGHYRRNERDPWHPFLMTLDANVQLVSLAVADSDPRMQAAAENDPRLSVSE
jgi:hypothetical protein